MTPEAGRGERFEHHGDHLGVTRRRRHADQLDAALQELARLAAAAADRAVGMREVAEPQRRLGVRVAVRDEPGDRDRCVATKREHVAVVVERPEARARGALVTAA